MAQLLFHLGDRQLCLQPDANEVMNPRFLEYPFDSCARRFRVVRRELRLCRNQSELQPKEAILVLLGKRLTRINFFLRIRYPCLPSVKPAPER